MLDVRWELLWRQMAQEEKIVCVVLMLAILLRLGYNFFKALGLSVFFSSNDIDTLANTPELNNIGKNEAIEDKVTQPASPPLAAHPPGSKRLRASLAYLALCLLALPVWWHTTALRRSPLPYHQMRAPPPSISHPLLLRVLLIPSVPGPLSSSTSTSSLGSSEEGASVEPCDHSACACSGAEEGAGSQASSGAVIGRNDIDREGNCNTGSDEVQVLATEADNSHGRPCHLEWMLASLQQKIDAVLNKTQNKIGANVTFSVAPIGDQSRVVKYTAQSSSWWEDPAWRQLNVRQLDDWLASELVEQQNGVYTLVVVEDEGPEEGGDAVGLVMGKYRHAVARGVKLTRARGTDLEAKIDGWAASAVKFFGAGGRAAGGEWAEAAVWPVGASGQVLLSFSLLNAQPEEEWRFSWGEQAVAWGWLAPITRALAPLATLSADAQVLYHTSSKILPEYSSAHQTFLLQEAQLPFFIDSEWPLDSSVSSPEIHGLRFLVYVPPKAYCPLMIQRADGHILSTGAFIIPGWGGVMIWNPSQCGNASKGANKDVSKGANKNASKDVIEDSNKNAMGLNRSPSHIPPEDLSSLMGVVVAQLRALLGLPPVPHRSHSLVPRDRVLCLPAPDTAFTLWEVDSLVRRQAAGAERNSWASLAALADVVTCLPNILLTHQITNHVKASLALLQQSRILANQNGHVEGAARAATSAHAHSEAAFFHHSILSLLYFPGEQKLAVYLPLCFPIALTVSFRFLSETFHYIRRYKKAN